jgi:hypothetical protein
MADEPYELQPEDQRYAEAVRRLLVDADLQKQLEDDPVGTLEGLGLNLSDDARRELETTGGAQVEYGEGLIVAPVVRVVTGGTRPVVSVVTGTSTIGAGRPDLKSPGKS